MFRLSHLPAISQLGPSRRGSQVRRVITECDTLFVGLPAGWHRQPTRNYIGFWLIRRILIRRLLHVQGAKQRDEIMLNPSAETICLTEATI